MHDYLYPRPIERAQKAGRSRTHWRRLSTAPCPPPKSIRNAYYNGLPKNLAICFRSLFSFFESYWIGATFVANELAGFADYQFERDESSSCQNFRMRTLHSQNLLCSFGREPGHI